MSKKVLVISTSPRTGSNSEALADEFIKGAAAVGILQRKSHYIIRKSIFAVVALRVGS